jgi:hypothetical protein
MRAKKFRYRFVLAYLFALVANVSGCGYPEVSPKTYEVANALYAAANRQSTEHVEKAAVITEELLAIGDISEREAGWLREIAEKARSGDWNGAAAEARALIADQAKPAP